MTTRAGRFLWLVTGAISLVFAVLAPYLVQNLESTRDAMLQTYRTGTWALVQVEQEYDRLVMASYVVQFRGDEAAKAAFRLRFDLFWSRLNIVLLGEETAGVRALPNVVPAFTRLRSLLGELEARYHIEKGPMDDSATIARRVREAINSSGDMIRDTVQEILMQDSAIYNRAKIEAQVRRTVVVLVLLFVLGMALIAVALSQTGRANRLLQETRTAYRDIERFRKVIQDSNEGLGMTDAEGIFTSANTALMTMLRVAPPGEIIGRQWQSVFDPVLRAYIEGEAQALMEKTGRWTGLVTLRCEEAPDLPVELILRRLKDGGVLMIARDRSKQVADAVARQELEQQLLVAQKMEAIARLASGFAHDFNNVLASIQGYGELLEEDLDEGDVRRDFATRILAGTRRGRDLVDRILAFARPRQESTGSCHLQDVLDELQGLMRGALSKAIVLQVVSPDEPIIVNCSSVQLLQVMMNLVVNARDAIGSCPGLIVIEVAAVLPWQPHATDRSGLPSVIIGQCAPGNSYARLTVRDDGAGITHDNIVRIFEPFFTTKPDGKGTGLGLAAVHNIVVGLGGQIVVRSEPGCGTEFTVFLPVVSAVATDVVSPSSSPVVGRLRVMLVEDEDMLRHITRTALERADMDVIACSNADTAYQRLMAGHETYDVIVTDEIMIGGTGRELIAALRAVNCRIPALLWSGNIEDADLDQGMVTPQRDNFIFRRKPLPISELIMLVKSLAKPGQHSSAAV